MIIIGTIDNNMMSNSITRIQLQPSNYLQISIAHLKMKVGEYEIFIYIISNVNPKRQSGSGDYITFC